MTETTIVRRLIQSLFDAGYLLRVDDGEGLGEYYMRGTLTTVLSACQAVELADIYAYSEVGKCAGSVRIVWQYPMLQTLDRDDAVEVINDHSLSLALTVDAVSKDSYAGR